MGFTRVLIGFQVALEDVFGFCLGPGPRGIPGGGSGRRLPVGHLGFAPAPARVPSDYIYIYVYLSIYSTKKILL